jgi:hypothetical protein
MPVSKFEKALPITGIAAGVLFAVYGFLPKMAEDPGDPQAVQIVKDHMTIDLIGAAAGGLFFVAMAFFATAVRQALRTREAGESTYSSVAYLGTFAVGLGVLLNSWLMFAGVDAADDSNRSAVNALSYLGVDGWLPWAAASAVMFLGAGIGALATGALPRWLGIVTIVLGVLSVLGPTGIAVYFATPVWLVVTGLVLSRRITGTREASVTESTPVHA